MMKRLLLACAAVLGLATPALAAITDHQLIDQMLQGDEIVNNSSWTPVCSYNWAANEFDSHAVARIEMPFDLKNNTGNDRTVQFKLEIDGLFSGIPTTVEVWNATSPTISTHAATKRGHLSVEFSPVPIWVHSTYNLAATDSFGGTQGANTDLQDGVAINSAWTHTLYAKLSTASVNLSFRSQDCVLHAE